MISEYPLIDMVEMSLFINRIYYFKIKIDTFFMCVNKLDEHYEPYQSNHGKYLMWLCGIVRKIELGFINGWMYYF